MSKKLTRQEIEHLAKLSRLELTDKEIEKYQRELSQILTYVGKIESFVKGRVRGDGGEGKRVLNFREDEVHEEFSREQMLKNVPEKEGQFVKVPKVFE